MKCSWKALSASWIHLLGTPAYTVYVSKDLQTYSSLSRKYSLLLRGPVCVIKKKRYILCMCVCVCVCVLSLWLAVCSDVQCLKLCSIQNNSGGSRSSFWSFSWTRPRGPQGADRNKTLLSTASYTSTPAAHKSPLWEEQSLKSQKRSCTTRKRGMLGNSVSAVIRKTQMWFSFMLRWIKA